MSSPQECLLCPPTREQCGEQDTSGQGGQDHPPQEKSLLGMKSPLGLSFGKVLPENSHSGSQVSWELHEGPGPELLGGSTSDMGIFRGALRRHGSTSTTPQLGSPRPCWQGLKAQDSSGVLVRKPYATPGPSLSAHMHTCTYSCFPQQHLYMCLLHVT